MKRFVEIENNAEQTEVYLKKLNQMGDYGNLSSCRRKYLLNYFDETTSDYCGNCDVCLTRLELFDGTVIAQKALSAVARLEERVGVNYVIDFLRGSRSEKIWDEHKQLSTYGVGADYSKEDWRNFINDLIQQQFLEKTDGMYPLLRLTEKSKDVLKGNVTVMMTKTRERIQVEEQAGEYEHELLRQLKETRRELADLENVPAYIVLSDATLMELATYLPHNKDEFRKISGFGEVKIEKYGKNFWDVVAAYCRQHNLKSRIHLKSPKRERKTRGEVDNDTKQQTLELFRLGHPIQKIAELRGLTNGTIETHLAYYVSQGKLAVEDVIPSEKIDVIQKTIEQINSTSLSRIKGELGDAYSYGEIRLVMAHREFFSQASVSS